MVKKSIIKRLLKVLLAVAIMLLIGKLILYYNNRKNSFRFETMQSTEMKIFTNNGKTFELSEMKAVILYNTVMVPIDETFEVLFENNYKKNSSKTISYETTNLNIDIDKKEISIPMYTTYNDEKMDDTITVEIEEYENIKYIPLYLISNIDGIDIKIDGKEIYSSKAYITSIEALQKTNEKHSIEIIPTTANNNTETYIGQDDGSLWREEALKRIEKYKKKDVNIAVKNKNNKAIQNVNANINMTNNEFKFGTAISDTKNVNNLRGISRNIFNLIGSENGFKWKGISILGYDRTDGLISYSKENDMKVRGHCLWWDYVTTEELKKFVGNIEELEEGTMAYTYSQYINKKITKNEAKKQAKSLQEKLENMVLNHIDNEVRRYLEVVEWDVANELISREYFKHYLYDQYFLSDGEFLNKTTRGYSYYKDNEDYYKFIAKCFDKVKSINAKAKLVINDNTLNGNQSKDYTTKGADIRIINNIKLYTNNLEAIGIEYHAQNRYQHSPQSYYNNINYVLGQTNIPDAVITEYDNYTSEKLGKYTPEENKTRADYLRDTLIMAYSNPKISEFCMWVYNGSHFSDEERQAYQETVYPWLNYTESGTSDENGYSTRLYKGDYEATVTLPNGKSKTVNFTVSDDSSDTVEVVFESKLEKIEISNNPDKTIYYQENNLNLSGGKIKAYYEDGTSQDIDMTSQDILISGYNKEQIGKQNITVTYQGKSATFEIEVRKDVTEEIKNIANSIVSQNKRIFEDNKVIYSNGNIKLKYAELVNSINNVYGIDQKTLEDIYNKQFNLTEMLFNEYRNKQIDITNETLIQIIKDCINISELYKQMISYYDVDESAVDTNSARNILNDLISKYNANVNVDISNTTDLVEQCKKLYENSTNTNDPATNYINKLRIIKTCDIISKIIDYDIEQDNKNHNSEQEGQGDTDSSSENETADQSKTANSSTPNQTQQGTVKETMRSGVYRIENNVIKNLSKATTPNTLFSSLGISNYYTINRGNYTLANDNWIATGDILRFYDSNFLLIVLGDINQDGLVKLNDLVRFRRVLLTKDNLNTAELYAADTNQDNNVNVGDLIGIRNLLLSN